MADVGVRARAHRRRPRTSTCSAASGRSNPKDERLFALAEVRELTIVRDENGRVVSLPELEHMLAEALEALRRFQARRSPRERLLWNRVRLNVWPPIDLAPERRAR